MADRLTDMIDTSSSTTSIDNPDSDPPQKFEIAEQKFAHFLLAQDYPPSICWLTPGSVLVSTTRRYYVRVNRDEALELARRRYVQGLERGLGIALTAVCNSNRETFATVIVPLDNLDRQYRLMGKKLKLSCPLHQLKGIHVRDPFKWELLERRHGERSRMIEV